MKQNNLNDRSKNRKEEYAELWKKDSIEINNNKLYDWMSSKVEKYKTILEIGCGAGISTLNLLKRNHNIIGIESNKYCVSMTRDLLHNNGYENVEIINKRVSENNCIELVKGLNRNIDLVICWNPGSIDTLSDEEIRIKYLEFIEMGYQSTQNLEDFTSNYSEDLIRSACKIGQTLNIDIHIVDRCVDKNANISEYIDGIEKYGVTKIISDQIEGFSNRNTMKEYKKILYKSFLLLR